VLRAKHAGHPNVDQIWSEEAAAAAVLWLRVLGLCCVQLDAPFHEQYTAAGLDACAALLARGQSVGCPVHDHDSSVDVAIPARRCYCAQHSAITCLDDALSCEPLLARFAEQGCNVEAILEPVVVSKFISLMLRSGALPDTNKGCIRAAGVALLSLATPCACNNVSGPSELPLVSGRSCVCGGCRVARYCSRDCQRQHWKQHKPVCQALAAASTKAVLPALAEADKS
jgi:hypothetical protein